jgi:hypothetical protein
LTIYPENGLAKYIVIGTAYVVREHGRYPLSKGRLWGIQEMVHCAEDFYDVDLENMRRGHTNEVAGTISSTEMESSLWLRSSRYLFESCRFLATRWSIASTWLTSIDASSILIQKPLLIHYYPVVLPADKYIYTLSIFTVRYNLKLHSYASSNLVAGWSA